MKRTVIFDLDGTILDTLGDLTDAVNFALAEFGFPPRTGEEVCSFVGNGVRKLIERASGKEDYEKQEELFQTFRRFYSEHCAVKTKPYEGIEALLKTLASRGIKTAVLSNKSDLEVKKLIKGYFPRLFDEVEGENEKAGFPRKPNPKGLLEIMRRLGASAEETVYIGDSNVDIQTAKNAGVDCISVTWGFKSEAFLLENGAKFLAHTPSEILQYLENE